MDIVSTSIAAGLIAGLFSSWVLQESSGLVLFGTTLPSYAWLGVWAAAGSAVGMLTAEATAKWVVKMWPSWQPSTVKTVVSWIPIVNAGLWTIVAGGVAMGAVPNLMGAGRLFLLGGGAYWAADMLMQWSPSAGRSTRSNPSGMAY